MNTNHNTIGAVSSLVLLLATAQVVQSQVLWTVGLDDNGWPVGTAGGADASFVQESGGVNALPGNQFGTPESGVDNDYYLAGDYSMIIEGNGQYDPVGIVEADELAAERALTDGETEERYHFNLPANLSPTNLLSVTFDAANLDGTAGLADPRWGVSVYFNGVLVQPQVVIRAAQLDFDYTTPPFTLASVNAVAGPGADNIVTLKGTSYNSDGGGAWMGIDYVRLNQESTAIPAPKFPWSVGSADNAWPAGDGGGANASFVEGNGSVNALPGKAVSTEAAGGADNDYYFAGIYTNVVTGNGTYQPVGSVSANEEAAERGFAGAENELRYHFNLPNTLESGSLVGVSFGAINLDTSGADPRYGVEVYVNGVLVQPEVVIRAAQLGKPITTLAFTLGSVNAQLGLGFDNIITLRGISYSAQGGGNSLGIDYVQFKPMPPAPVLPWSVGRHDNAQPAGDGGGANTTFVQENAVVNPLPGSPTSPEVDGQADNDYYFAGIYSTVIPANGTYEPVGDVPYNEEAAERAFAAADNDLRYHFNLPSTLTSDTLLTFSYSPISLDESGGDARYGAAVYVNNVLVQPETLIRPDRLNRTIFTPAFTLAQVNAQVGPGYDNIVSLRGVNYNADGGGNWMGIDFVRLDPVLPPSWPIDVQTDNNSHSGGVGGGRNAFFVQEAGVNPLPGNPAGGEVNTQSDDDYYMAGVFTNAIPAVTQMYGEYEPAGTVLVNEYVGERAFAGSDNEKRYHFNLPTTLKSTDQLVVSFDAVDLDATAGLADPRYGVEIYFNGTLVQPEITVRNAELDVDYTTAPFTLASVNAQVGPGYDNIVTLKGINYNADGGGNWMGIDYVQVSPMPTPVFPWAVGQDDDGWPVGDGGGPNATFVQENGSINELPGSPYNHEIAQQADNDYYFAGVYTNVIDANGAYTPVGLVPRNEEAAERAFAGGDLDLRYHFNLPSTLKPTNQVAVTFDAFNLDDSVADPHFGIEVYFNNVLVQPEITIRTNQLGVAYTTPAFTLASVNAQMGLGSDNIVSLRGVSYNADGGGNWMGIDYVQLNAAGDTQPLKFTAYTAKSGKVTLTWTGTGNLEWAPVLGGQWTAVSPAPTSPYTEDMPANTTSRFYRLRKP